jgi:3-hydroxyacyl-CoA dehydrogenase
MAHDSRGRCRYWSRSGLFLLPLSSLDQQLRICRRQSGRALRRGRLCAGERTERPELKSAIIAEIDARTRPDVVIASSSSGIPSSQFIDRCRSNPARVLIGHPFNPPHLMPLVEVVPHPGTSLHVVDQALDFYRSLGSRPVHIKREVPGFVANRLQLVLCQEAYSLVSRGILTAKELGTY